MTVKLTHEVIEVGKPDGNGDAEPAIKYEIGLVVKTVIREYAGKPLGRMGLSRAVFRH